MSNVARVAGQAANTLSKPLNVEEVFSTYLYEGNASTNTITNGIDLSNEGGLVWCKRRDASSSHALYDTERGASGTDALISNTTDAEVTGSMSSFNNNGFTLDSNSRSNASGDDMVSWTFRKAPKFFDVQTWSGNSTSGRAIPHNLGTTPGMIIVKWYDGSQNWAVWHKDLTAGTFLLLNESNAVVTNSNVFTTTSPTDSVFYVGSDYATNGTSANYVAYLFAHNDGDGEFGPDGDADVIKCGSFTTDAAAKATITLGWESQWVMVKRTDGTGGWIMVDIMRGAPQTNANYLYANLSGAEAAVGSYRFATPTATGFVFDGGLAASADYIYIAIRRGPMAVPTDATDVFAIDTGASSTPSFDAGFPIDASLIGRVDGTDKWYFTPRLTGSNYLNTATTAAESSSPAFGGWDYQTQYYGGNLPSNYQAWMWKRAPSFFDAVAYTGTGSARTISHNLGVAPEMMWVKKRDQAENWLVYHSATGNTKSLRLNSTIAAYTDTNWNDTTPTDSVFSLGSSSVVNYSGHKFIAYLFASLDGVSKVGSYTGNGTSQNIDCGFSSGARFVLIKRTDSTGDWEVYDTQRGINAGNDSHLQLNTTTAQFLSAGTIDPYSAGFTVNVDGSDSRSNASGASYIFYAIA
jgi:hypothetical protein